jgi:hypothetical protein
MLLWGVVMWSPVLMGVLHLAVPSAAMRRDTGDRAVYYLLWWVLLCLLLSIHYVLLAKAHHAGLALMGDALGLGLFLLGHALLRRARRGNAPVPVEEPHE